MFINSLPLLPNSSLICSLEDMREWLPISWSYSTLRLPKFHHTFGANVVIIIIKSIALGLSPICIMNVVLYVLAELPVRVSGDFQAVSHKDLPSSYILLSEPLYSWKLSRKPPVVLLSMFWGLIVLTSSVLKSCIVLNPTAEKGATL